MDKLGRSRNWLQGKLPVFNKFLTGKKQFQKKLVVGNESRVNFECFGL